MENFETIKKIINFKMIINKYKFKKEQTINFLKTNKFYNEMLMDFQIFQKFVSWEILNNIFLLIDKI